MTASAESVLAGIERGPVPPVILVGGNNDYLVEQAFHKIRDRILESDPSVQLEQFSETTDLGVVLDAYRTHGLFVSKRLLLLPEVNAFVTAGELASLLKKAVGDWTAAKTERKRSSALAKLLHAIALVGLDLDSRDSELADALGVEGKDAETLSAMLEIARASNKRVTRGEGDAALLTEAVSRGGAPGTTLLMRTGPLPDGSATIEAIERAGVVIACDLGRSTFSRAFQAELSELQQRFEVTFDGKAVEALLRQLGIERVLDDKYSKEIPDLRGAISQAERLAGFVGKGKSVTAAIVLQETTEVAGGARFEFASLVIEGKLVEAVEKLRDLVAQSRRDKPKVGEEIAMGGFVLTLADEVRQILGIQSFCKAAGIDPRRRINYNEFKGSMAPRINDYLVEYGLVRQKVHPFPLMKRFEAAGRFREKGLIRSLSDLAQIEFDRKSGGAPIDVRLESAVLGFGVDR